MSGEATGLLVKLPDWLYPADIHVETGHVQFDNYAGAWGRIQRYSDQTLETRGAFGETHGKCAESKAEG